MVYLVPEKQIPKMGTQPVVVQLGPNLGQDTGQLVTLAPSGRACAGKLLTSATRTTTSPMAYTGLPSLNGPGPGVHKATE